MGETVAFDAAERAVSAAGIVHAKGGVAVGALQVAVDRALPKQ
jgi:hypothetical protein